MKSIFDLEERRIRKMFKRVGGGGNSVFCREKLVLCDQLDSYGFILGNEQE